jgi:hypothetical protein
VLIGGECDAGAACSIARAAALLGIGRVSIWRWIRADLDRLRAPVSPAAPAPTGASLPATGPEARTAGDGRRLSGLPQRARSSLAIASATSFGLS